FGRNRAHKETGYMAAIPERYFQEKTLGLLGASIYGAGRAPRDGFTASLRPACSLRSGHFVKSLKRHFAAFLSQIFLLLISAIIPSQNKYQ
ncbi:hypothetical protein KUG23_20560, partial [Yersinia enterocolitica]|uniref:hypothetical protein n=1 Tax=Yersinia enterocolitica TaxID=630 RepID=UPI001EFDE3A4